MISRLKLGHVVMVLAAFFALVLNLAVLNANDATVEVSVASSEILQGTLLGPGHLTTVEVAADDLLISRFVLAAEAEGLLGAIAARHIAVGEPIALSDFRDADAEDGLRAISIPLDPGRAVGGELAVGDSVDVVWVSEGIATYIAAGVEILSIPRADSNALGARSGYAPTVAVDASQALQIVAALDSGELHLVRSTGASTPDVERLSATGADLGDAEDE